AAARLPQGAGAYRLRRLDPGHGDAKAAAFHNQGAGSASRRGARNDRSARRQGKPAPARDGDMSRAPYEGVVIAVPLTIPYVRYSTKDAHWFLGRALSSLLDESGLKKEQLDGLCVSSFTLFPDTAVGLTQH